MPPTPFPLELGSRKSYICRSCLAHLQSASRLRVNNAASSRSYSTQRAPPSLRPAPPNNASKESMLDNNEVKIRYFNEERPGRYRQLRDSEEFDKVMNGLDEGVESTINELESKLKDTAKLIQLMEKYGMKDKAYELKRTYMSRQAIQGSPPDIPEDCWSSRKAYHVGRLNTYLRNAFEDMSKGKITPKIVLSTWKYYSAARKVLSTSWEKVPKEVWQFLWQVLSYERDWNASRMAHIHVLAKDMQAAGFPLDGSQQLLAIEAMFISGWQKEAIDNWKKAAATLGSKSETLQGYWELGARMCSLSGDLERAERAVDTLFSSSPSADARILIPLIRAYVQKEATEEKSLELYHRLRDLLGASMTIEDYDEVIAAFLSANHTELGLQVFVDMMFSAAVEIRGKSKLPPIVGNQFFLGKWLKRLIGAGDLNGAFSVIKFMEAKGILGSAIQLNGLIGAWLRSETAENAQNAEELAWAMIHSRLVFVNLRQREALLDWPLKLAMSGSREPTPGLRFVPKATLETFCLMAENYRNRGLHKEMETLLEAFAQAEITTNSFMMNQVIESYIQDGKANKALEFYRSMTQEHHIRPDAYTFLALYRSLSVNRLVTKYSELVEQDVAMCRGFFRDLVEMPWVRDPESILDGLPRFILHSFLKLEDYAGMLAASRAMRELFDFAPAEALLIELAAGTTALNFPTQRNTRRLLEASRTIEPLLQERRAALQSEGRSLENLTPKQKAEELFAVLEKLVLLKAKASEEETRPLYEEAAQEMGVYDIVLSNDSEQITGHPKVSSG